MARTVGVRRVTRKSYGDGPGRPIPVDNGDRIREGQRKAQEAGTHIGRPLLEGGPRSRRTGRPLGRPRKDAK